MPPARLFISHSARTDPAALALIKRLYAELNGEDLEILVDQISLESGEDWTDQLFDWMLDCHGAVLLLSQRALQSAWVEHEATILNLRKRVDASFELIPVFLAGVNDTVLGDPKQSRLSALDLKRLQALRAGDAAGEEALLSTLRQKSELLKEHWGTIDPARRLRREIAGLLFETPNLALQGFAESLDPKIKQWLWGNKEKLVLALALRMAEQGLQKAVGALEDLYLHLGIKAAEVILGLLASLLVNPQAARSLAEIVAGQPPYLGVCLNAIHEDTGRLYAWRACGSSLPGRLQGVTNVDAGLGREALREEIIQAIQELTGADNLEEAREQMEFSEKAHIVVFPASRPDSELLRELSELFPNLRFCCLLGSSAELAEEPGAVLKVLQPPLQLREEENLLEPYRKGKMRLAAAWKSKR